MHMHTRNMHMHMHMHTHMQHAHAYAHAHAHAHVNMCMCMRVCMCMSMHVHAHACACMCMCIRGSKVLGERAGSVARLERVAVLPSRQALTMGYGYTHLWLASYHILCISILFYYIMAILRCDGNTSLAVLAATSNYGRARASARPPWRPCCRRRTRSVWPSS